MVKKTIADVEVTGKTVIMRVDFNVPLENGSMTDDRRVSMALESIRCVTERGGKLILMSHLGRPQGNGFEAEYSLRPLATRLKQLLGGPVAMAPDCVGEQVEAMVRSLKTGEVLLLENLRFHKAEKDGDDAFAAGIAKLGELYCNNAFGTCHREDASMVAVPRAMDGKPKVVGLLVEKEIKYLGETIANPQRPFVAIVGCAKVSDKLGMISSLLDKVDTILIGGAMSYTFLCAQAIFVGSSLVEEDCIDDARAILDQAARSKAKLVLPVDHVCGQQLSTTTPIQVSDQTIPAGWVGLDIGPKTIASYITYIAGVKTIVWNGPMGAFETKPFDVGTRKVAEAIAAVTRSRRATSIIGGGDSAAAIHRFGLADQVSHISTGGGASLKMLEGKPFKSVQLLDAK